MTTARDFEWHVEVSISLSKNSGVKLHFEQFLQERSRLISEGKTNRVRKLEREYLIKNPDNTHALFLHAQTMRRSKKTVNEELFINLSKTAFLSHRYRKFQCHIKNISNIIEKISDEYDSSSKTALIEKFLLQDYIDDVWGWAEFVPIQAFPGEVVDLDSFGKYKIVDPRRVIEKRLSRRMAWEAPLVALMAELAKRLPKGKAVVDVGANIGCTCIPIALHHDGPVFAFEPLPKNFAELTENVSLNNIENIVLLNQACGSEAKIVRMTEGLDSNPGLAKVGEGTEEVPQICLDDEFAKQPVGLIKIDVEGYEKEVLRGAQNLILRDFPFIIAEIFDVESSAFNEHLTKLGYKRDHVFRHEYVFYKRGTN